MRWKARPKSWSGNVSGAGCPVASEIAPGVVTRMELFHHAFEPRRAGKAAHVGLPATRKGRLPVGRRRNEGAFTDAGRYPSARSEQLIGLRNGDKRTFEISREVAHGRKTITRHERLAVDRFDELIRELHVERAGITRLQAQPERLHGLIFCRGDNRYRARSKSRAARLPR